MHSLCLVHSPYLVHSSCLEQALLSFAGRGGVGEREKLIKLATLVAEVVSHPSL